MCAAITYIASFSIHNECLLSKHLSHAWTTNFPLNAGYIGGGAGEHPGDPHQAAGSLSVHLRSLHPQNRCGVV